MKRCPECLEVYEGAQRFCDVDGAPLIVEVNVPRGKQHATPVAGQDVSPNQKAWILATLGVIVGMMVCAAAFIVFFASTPGGGREPLREESLPPLTRTARQPAPPEPSSTATVLDTIGGIKEPKKEEEETAAEEGEEELPEETAQQPAAAQPPPAPEKRAPAARVKEGFVSTGGGRGGDKQDQALIQLTDGKTLEVDAVWQDRQGVWYRRGALVTFVERGRVKEITGKEEPPPASAP